MSFQMIDLRTDSSQGGWTWIDASGVIVTDSFERDFDERSEASYRTLEAFGLLDEDLEALAVRKDEPGHFEANFREELADILKGWELSDADLEEIQNLDDEQVARLLDDE